MQMWIVELYRCIFYDASSVRKKEHAFGIENHIKHIRVKDDYPPLFLSRVWYDFRTRV